MEEKLENYCNSKQPWQVCQGCLCNSKEDFYGASKSIIQMMKNLNLLMVVAQVRMNLAKITLYRVSDYWEAWAAYM